MHHLMLTPIISTRMINNATPTRAPNIPSFLTCNSPTTVTYTQRATSRIMHKRSPNYIGIQSELQRSGCDELKPRPDRSRKFLQDRQLPSKLQGTRRAETRERIPLWQGSFNRYLSPFCVRDHLADYEGIVPRRHSM